MGHLGWSLVIEIMHFTKAAPAVVSETGNAVLIDPHHRRDNQTDDDDSRQPSTYRRSLLTQAEHRNLVH
jgi:hypothetical protein